MGDTNLSSDVKGLPPLFVERLRAIVPDDRWQSVIESFSVPKKTVCRVNSIKARPDAVLAELNRVVEGQDSIVRQLPWYDHALVVEPEHRDVLTHSAAATDGRLYIQGASSILAALILDPQPDEWNLDLAAAPGGKASHMAALMHNQGKLSVVEPIKKRMYRLADTLKRLGITIGKTYLMDGRKVGGKVPERFDRIMLDAPCSSESRMRTDDTDSTSYWSERKIREQSRKQAGLLLSAFAALKPGGEMTYCTCSFAPEENEMIVDQLLQAEPEDASILPISFPEAFPSENLLPGMVEFNGRQFDESLRQTRRIMPGDLFDAFYIARIGKSA